LLIRQCDANAESRVTNKTFRNFFSPPNPDDDCHLSQLRNTLETNDGKAASNYNRELDPILQKDIYT